MDNPPGHAGPVELNRHHVDPNACADSRVKQAVGLCELTQLGQLAPRDRLLRQPVVAAPPSLDLNDHQAFPVEHDKVDLAVAQAYVPFNQAHPGTTQPLLGGSFSNPSEGGPACFSHPERLILLSAFVPAKEDADIVFQDLAREDRAGHRHRGE